MTDYKKALELDPTCAVAARATVDLPPRITIQNEKMKEEMIGYPCMHQNFLSVFEVFFSFLMFILWFIGKLKDLGNSLLGKFGLSTDNFNFVQDPNTGIKRMSMSFS